MHHHHSRSLLMLRVWAQVPQLRYGNGGHKCATALATLRTLCPAWNLRAKGAENMLRANEREKVSRAELVIYTWLSSTLFTQAQFRLQNVEPFLGQKMCVCQIHWGEILNPHCAALLLMMWLKLFHISHLTSKLWNWQSSYCSLV